MEKPSDSRTQAAGDETKITRGELEDLRQRLATMEAHLADSRGGWLSSKLFRAGRARNITLLTIAALFAGAVILNGEDALKALFISSSGNVGIGVLDPAKTLDVAGTIRSRTGGFQFPDDTQQTTAAVIPAGAVVPFNLAGCPAGWNEYQFAYGRFIRGIDKSGQSIDPAGQRSPNNVQDYAIPQITGSLTGVNGAVDQAWPWGFSPGTSGAFKVDPGYAQYNKYNGDYNPRGGAGQVAQFDSRLVLPNNTAAEARPKNVALLYCQKG